MKLREPLHEEPITVQWRSGHMVRVGRNFDEQALARLVAVFDGT